MRIMVPFVSFVFLLLTACAAPGEAAYTATGEAAQPEPQPSFAAPQLPCPRWEVQVDSHLDPANPSNWVDPIRLALAEWDRALQGMFETHITLTDRPLPYSEPKGCVLSIEADPTLSEKEEGAVGYTDQTLVNPKTGEKFGHIRFVPKTMSFVGAEALVIHELGHFFGLPHSEVEGSVMHLPLREPACITDADAVGACSHWGACPVPGLRADRCKSIAISGTLHP